MKKAVLLSAVLTLVALGGLTHQARGSDNNDPKKIPSLKSKAESSKEGKPWWDLGLSYEQNQYYQEAIDALKKFFTLPHAKAYEWVAWRALSNCYDNQGQYAQAISTANNCIGLVPDRIEGFVALEKAFLDNGQFDEAIAAGKRAIEIKPEEQTYQTYAHMNMGVAYGFKKQYGEAMIELQKAIDIYANNVVAVKWMGRFYIDNNNFGKAAAAYKKAVEMSPAVDNYLCLADAYYRMGKYDDALAAVAPTFGMQTVQGIGAGLAEHGDGYPTITGLSNNGPAKKAELQLGDTILKVDGKSAEGWSLSKAVGRIKGEAGTPVVLTLKRADTTFEKTIVRANFLLNTAASSIARRSLILLRKGNLADAADDARSAFACDPTNGIAIQALGSVNLLQGHFDEAYDFLNHIKNNPSARLFQATALIKMGKPAEAEAMYLTISDADLPQNNVPRMEDRRMLLQAFKPIVVEHREKAASLMVQGQSKEAMTELVEAEKVADDSDSPVILEELFTMANKNPLLAELTEDARTHAIRGEYLIKEGNFAPAIAEFKLAIRLAPYSAKLYYNTAMVNEQLKNFPEAIRFMKTYLKAAPDAPDTRAAKDKIIEWEFAVEKGK